MLKTISFVALLLLVLPAWCQQLMVSGFVTDSETSEPLIGATVWVKGKEIGTSTDYFGHYSIAVHAGNQLKVQASFIGYKTKEHVIGILNENKRIDFELNTGGVELEEVDVIGTRKIENRIETGLIKLSTLELKNLPSIGEHDVLKIAQLMPGIQGGSEGRSGLYVRGGTPDQNQFLLDGTPIYYVNHIGNFISLFHPEIISDMQIYKGSFPARYGGRLSAVVDLRMREGNKKAHGGSLGIGLISSDILLEGPIKKETSSYLFSYRRFYLDALTIPITYFASEGFSLGYNFYDLYGKIAHAVNENNKLYLSVYSGNDAIGYRAKPWESEDFIGRQKTSWGNILANIRLNSKINSRLIADFIVGYTRYHYNMSEKASIDSIFMRNSTQTMVNEFSVKSEFSLKAKNWYELSFGTNANQRFFQPGLNNNYLLVSDSVYLDKEYGSLNTHSSEVNIYVENIINPLSFLRFNIGSRFSNYFVEGKHYYKLEPRIIAVAGNVKTGAVKMAYVQNMQALHMLSFQNISTPTDLWMPATGKIPPSESSQISISYAKSFHDDYEFSVEAYSKKLTHLIEYKEGVSYLSGEQDWQQKVEINGEGHSRGIELLLRKNRGNTTGWVGYTLAKTDRYFENKNNGQRYPFIYDRRHDFSIVVSHRINEKYNISCSWVFGTGYPFTLENGYYKTFEYPGLDYSGNSHYEPFTLSGTAVLYPGKNSIRFKNYHKLDLAFQIKGKTKKGREKIWSFNLYNVYNQQNPAYYYYSWKDRDDHSKGISLWQQSGIPLVPSFTYRVKW